MRRALCTASLRPTRHLLDTLPALLGAAPEVTEAMAHVAVPGSGAPVAPHHTHSHGLPLGMDGSTASMMALGVAATSVVAKEALFRWTLAVGERLHSQVLVANAWHHRSDALSSVVAFGTPA